MHNLLKIVIVILLILLPVIVNANNLDTKSIKEYLNDNTAIESEIGSGISAGVSGFAALVQWAGIIIAIFNIIHIAIVLMAGTAEKLEFVKKKALYVALGLFVALQASSLAGVIVSLFSNF